MSLSTKILLILGGILLFGGMIFIIVKQQENATRQLAIQTQITQQQQMIDGIVRSQSQWATKDDMNKFITDQGVNLKAIQDDLNKLNASVTAANTISTNSNAQVGNNLPSTGTGTKNPNPTPPTCKDGSPCADPFGYLAKEQDLDLSEDFGATKVPIGKVGFSAWQDKPWSVNIKPREYDVTSVVGTDENQKVYFYNKFNVKVDGTSYEIPIKTAQTVQEYPSAKFSWWNPRALMGVDGGVNISHVTGEVVPHLGLGIMSYGQYKTNPDISILEVGLGYEAVGKTGELVITPVAYNIGKKLFSPVMTNLYIGPSFTVATDGSLGVGLGLRVGL